jgi:hypothetical protein
MGLITYKYVQGSSSTKTGACYEAFVRKGARPPQSPEDRLAVAVLVASTRVVPAREQYEHPQYGFYQNRPPCTSVDDCDRRTFDKSGTPGRMGLGADPAHPEGPGNVLD